MVSYTLMAAISPLLLLTAAALPAATAGHQLDDPYRPTVRSGATLVVPPGPGNVGGDISAALVSTVKSCYFKGPPDAQVWTCLVGWTLELRVPPLVCGETTSPAAPGLPPELRACGGIWPAYAARMVDSEVAWIGPLDPQVPYSHRAVAGNEVCQAFTPACVSWSHPYAIPAPHVYQTSADLNLVSGHVYETLRDVGRRLPTEVRIELIPGQVAGPARAGLAAGASFGAAAPVAGPGEVLP